MLKQNRERSVTLGIMLLVICIAGSYMWHLQRVENELARQNTPAMQAFSSNESTADYTDLRGNPVSLEDYVGRVLIATSWASWSPQSKTSLQILSKVASSYSEEAVKIIAINRAEPKQTAEAYLNTIGSPGGVMLVLDPADRYYTSISGYAMPETVIYNQAGEIEHRIRGDLSQASIEARVTELLTVN